VRAAARIKLATLPVRERVEIQLENENEKRPHPRRPARFSLDGAVDFTDSPCMLRRGNITARGNDC
jgi:hypothetical protein